MNSRRRLVLAAAASAVAAPWCARAQTAGDEALHAPWSALLARHVVLLAGGRASQLRYAGVGAERAALDAYLAALAAVPPASFEGWSTARQMAFLINAYNAHTVALILTRHPNLQSIRDLGSLLQSPWKRRFVPLLGQTLSLDGIEHEMLRARGRYDDPRLHFAVNCASVGCPMLREEAYLGSRLDAQLDEQAARFMSDRSRNRFDAAGSRLELSRIFDWYGEDFRLGHRGIVSVPAFAARHADVLADAPADRARIRAQALPVRFLDYDWSLNDVPAR